MIGIDLGTSNSVVAAVLGGVPTVIENATGSRLTPSLVAALPDGKVLVGDAARKQARLDPQYVFRGTKRLMGRGITHRAVQDLRLRVAYDVAADAQGNACVRTPAGLWTPQQVAAQVLQSLKQSAERKLGREVKQAVIAVPAHFDELARRATLEAAQQAGLVIEQGRLINEPTAAAIAFDRAVGDGSEKVIAVVDLGGGTFDVSIVRAADDVWEVLATDGDLVLGGDDWDAALATQLQLRFERQHNLSLSSQRIAMRRIYEAAEAAKCDLSSLEEVDVSVTYLTSSPHGAGTLHLDEHLSRQEAELYTQSLLDRIEGPCLRALRAARLTARDLDAVVLVGGMTRWPAVRRRIADIFDREPLHSVHPDEAVAIGAALWADSLSDRSGAMLDVTPLSFGVRTTSGEYVELIAPNTRLPATRSSVFTTSRDGQRDVVVLIEQQTVDGERVPLGEFRLTGIPPARAGEPEIEVVFALDSAGLLHATATEQRAGSAELVLERR